MKTRWFRLVVITAMGLTSFAVVSQQPAPAATQAPASAQEKISPGTLIQVEITSDVDAKKTHAGDVFRTRLWEDVRNGDKVVLPQKTILVGHVVDAQPRTKANPESKLTVAFDKAVLKDDSELPLHGVVERVQLSPMAAAAAAASARSYNPGLSPGSTTNVAMPTQLPLPGEGGDSNQLSAPGPTNMRDTTIATQADASVMLTVLTSNSKGM